MADLDKKSLSERDICTKFITPAVKLAGWDELSQIREEVGRANYRSWQTCHPRGEEMLC